MRSGMPKMRVDKDTIGDLGTVTVWTEEADESGVERECCPSSSASTITDSRWEATGQLAGCRVGMTLSASGGGGSGYAATIVKASLSGNISTITITNGGSGYTSDPSLVASDAACTCTAQIWTCSSTSRSSAAGTDRTT